MYIIYSMYKIIHGGANSNYTLGVVFALVVAYFFVLDPILRKQQFFLNERFEQQIGTLVPDNRQIYRAKCSPSCCSRAGSMPRVTHDNSGPVDPNLVPSTLKCIGDEGAGCVCLTKDQVNFFGNRGGNS